MVDLTRGIKIICPHCEGIIKFKKDRPVAIPKASTTEKETKTHHVLRRQEWTSAEDQFLREFYHCLPARELVKKLNRTKFAIFNHARKLGLMEQPKKEISYEEFLKKINKSDEHKYMVKG